MAHLARINALTDELITLLTSDTTTAAVSRSRKDLDLTPFYEPADLAPAVRPFKNQCPPRVCSPALQT